jgi:competence protein CoiA
MASDPGGAWRVALEAQLSPITPDDIKARTERMRADLVASAWVSDRAAPSWLGAAPSVRLEHKDNGLVVVEGLVKFWRRSAA